MGRTLTVSAPAKVNWYLAVGDRRADGFHELETLFVRLNLADTLKLSLRASGVRLKTSARLPKGPKNLAVRAALLLKEKTGYPGGTDIVLTKRVPSAAGLGGGSSDAAAVLVGLNKLWKTGLSKAELCALGAQIGSDVPFFVTGARYAIGRGRGEKLRAVRSSLRLWHVLVKPSFGISTKEAYGEFARLKSENPSLLTPPKSGVKMWLRFLEKDRSKRLPQGFFNSLEVALNKRLKAISEIKIALLEQGAEAALLSGSGSTVFGVFLKNIQARKAARFFQGKRGVRVFVD